MTSEPPDLPPAPDARLPIATPPASPPAGAQPAAAAPDEPAPRHGLGLWLLLLAWVVLLALGWVGWHHGVLWTRSEDEQAAEDPLEAPAGGHGPTLVAQPKPRATVPRGPLPLRLRLPGGAAAAGALVRAEDDAAPRGRVAWQHADAAGSVTLPDVPCGPLRVLVLGGGAPALVEVEAGALPRGEQVVSLPAGATLRVQVRAPSGQPVPFAKLKVEHASGLPWVDIGDGGQRLDGRTDVRGERRLHDLPPGKLTLTARLGTRAAEVQLDLREGSTQEVQLTLPDARPQDAAEEVEAQEVLPATPR